MGSRAVMWLRALLRQRDVEREMQREMAAHLAMEQERLEGTGLSPAEAHRQAMVTFGGVEQQKEAVRDEWGTRVLADFSGDFRYAVRRLRRTPWVAAVIVVTLAVVIGANTAIFGLVDALFLRELPLPHASELVAVRPMSGGNRVTVTYPAFQALRHALALPPMAAYFFEPLRVGTDGAEELVWGDAVTGEYFGLLGVQPMLGRLIAPNDELVGAPVAVVSAAFWRAHLGADSSRIGKTIRVNGRQFTLIGVTAPSFAGLYLAHEFQVAVPITASGVITLSSLAMHYLDVIARLDRGTSRPRAAFMIQTAFLGCCQHLDVATAAGAAASGEQVGSPDDAPTGDSQISSSDPRWHVELPTASHGLTWSTDYRSEYQRVLFGMIAGVLLLTLIACANIATLLLARAASRARELSVRASLGASRGRLVRQLLAESLLLGLVGAALGVLLAQGATVVLVGHLPSSVARLHDALAWRLDPVILLFTVAIMLSCTLFFGLWPARRATRVDLLTALQGRGPRSVLARGWGADRLLVVGQLSLALVLVASAALFVATLKNLSRSDATYGDTRIILARVAPPIYGQDAVLKASYDPLIAAIAAIPGVSSVAAAGSAPVYPLLWMYTSLRMPEFTDAKGRGPSVRVDPVDANFFAATAVRITQGRAFNAGDAEGVERVAIVSESFARHYFGTRDPLGEVLAMVSDSTHPARIVGVATDTKYDDVRSEPAEMLYEPLAQGWQNLSSLSLVVRVSGSPAAVVPLLRKRIGQVAPALAVDHLTSLDDFLADALARERLMAVLGFAFGVVALLLAAIGLYGLVAYQTMQRTREIGIRMALGAVPKNAVGLVIRQTVALAAVGIALGLPLARGVARAVRTQLYGIDSADPRVLLGSSAVLLLAALAAGSVPARRAARVDPIVALREE